MACMLLTGCRSIQNAGSEGKDSPWGIANPPPILQGKVTDSKGDSICGVSVEVFTGPGPTWIPLATVQTDPGGRFWVCLSQGGGHYDRSTGRHTDISIGLSLKHPQRHDHKAESFDWTGFVPNTAGYHTIGDLSIQLAQPEIMKKNAQSPPVPRTRSPERRGEP
jgi:hypothetical protein